jgi:hypothetical protein
MTTNRSPLSVIARGLVAGAAGTAVLTGYQMLVARLRGSGADGGGGPPTSWEKAPAPAQVAEKISSGVFDEELPLSEAGTITNIMHWSYGTFWGALYAIAKASFPQSSALPAGAAFGTSVWSASYAQLVPMGIYKPPWKYPARETGLDISYHLVYGVAAALVYELVE